MMPFVCCCSAIDVGDSTEIPSWVVGGIWPRPLWPVPLVLFAMEGSSLQVALDDVQNMTENSLGSRKLFTIL